MNQDTQTISDKLLDYLRAKVHNPDLDYAAPPEQVHGGFETQIYRFQLNGAPEKLSGALILRLYPAYYGTFNAQWESCIQNVLAEQGFPVAKSYMLCIDLSVLGGAFFIMDFMPGYPMVDAPVDSFPEFLGKTHAALHNFETQPIIQALVKAGIDEGRYRIAGHKAWLDVKIREFPWLQTAGDWLIAHMPPEPETLAVCHGDFHPLNILIQDGKVTGVLDWSGFVLADPAFDIGTTLVLLTIPFKAVGPTLKKEFVSVDFDDVAQRYLDAYRMNKALDDGNLAYYRVWRCVYALINGAEGQAVWQNPDIIKDLVDYIHKVTGIRITAPAC